MGIRLGDGDEGLHGVGAASNWNESQYLDFSDAASGLSGWLRIGSRPNEGRAAASTCLYLPDASVAVAFETPTITTNELSVGGQQWEVLEPWTATRVRYQGTTAVLNDPWTLTDPKHAFAVAERLDASIDITSYGQGPASILGSDQAHIDLIFLPGQADFHYQHLVHTIGTVRVGERTWSIDARGAKDHSWGPRNWHSKQYFRWLIGAIDDDNGFLLTRGVGATKQTLGGCVWNSRALQIVDHFEMRNTYGPGPHYELRHTDLQVQTSSGPWAATGTPRNWLPLRHRQVDPGGSEVILRIVKSPMQWTFVDGRQGVGMAEYHDVLDPEGRPVGLNDHVPAVAAHLPPADRLK